MISEHATDSSLTWTCPVCLQQKNRPSLGARIICTSSFWDSPEIDSVTSFSILIMKSQSMRKCTALPSSSWHIIYVRNPCPSTVPNAKQSLSGHEQECVGAVPGVTKFIYRQFSSRLLPMLGNMLYPRWSVHDLWTFFAGSGIQFCDNFQIHKFLCMIEPQAANM